MEEERITLTEVFVDLWNDFMLALPGIIIALIIFIVGLYLARWIAGLLGRRILARMDDPLMGKFLTNTLRVLLVLGVLLLALQTAGLGNIASGLFGAAGIGAVVVGFAFQDIGENFIAGIVLAFSRPFDVNDTIKIDDHFGKVRALNMRYTHLKTFDGKDIYVPNADVMKKPLQNFTADGYIRYDFTVGIAYEDDISGAKQVIQAVLDNNENLVQDQEHANFVVEDGLGVSTVDLKVYFWVETMDYRVSPMILKGQVIREVKQTIMEHSYNMPADITEVKIYGGAKDIPLRIQFDDTPNSELENVA
ncbi:mechanosensitive ion channel protein MscS [Lewinellaceae bacterium SD302]|nr:mechanosensitive ion channel protein MscS [Lewinellaceae bacterium SD302]